MNIDSVDNNTAAVNGTHSGERQINGYGRRPRARMYDVHLTHEKRFVVDIRTA